MGATSDPAPEQNTSTATASPAFEVEQSFLSLKLLHFPCCFRSKSGVEHCSRWAAAQAESLPETHTLRVNEAAYKNHTTLNSSRETDALETILKTLSMRPFKGDKVQEQQLREVIILRVNRALQRCKLQQDNGLLLHTAQHST